MNNRAARYRARAVIVAVVIAALAVMCADASAGSLAGSRGGSQLVVQLRKEPQGSNRDLHPEGVVQQLHPVRTDDPLSL